MAGAAPRQDLLPSILTPDYIELLQGLCVVTKPSIRDVAAVFAEFGRTLGGGWTPQPSTSRAGRSRGESSGAFERCCTRGAAASVVDAPCWLIAELEPWNRVLSRNCVELREHCPGCLTLEGFVWPESNAPDIADALRASLLVHVLLRQHRCVTRVFMNESMTALESDIFWHVLRTASTGVTYFKFLAYRIAPIGAPVTTPWPGASMWVDAASRLAALHSLHVAHARLDLNAALILAEFMARTTTLKAFAFYDVKTTEDVAAYLLNSVAHNKTLTSLCVADILFTAGQGQPLGDLVRTHATLEVLQVTCSGLPSPSALMRAVVQSKSLKTLSMHNCSPSAEDLEAMAAALTRHPPSYHESGEGVAAPPTPTCSLENVTFFGSSRPSDERQQRAYASLIGGVLKKLKLTSSGLGGVFATGAARQLHDDTQLKLLNVQGNFFSVDALCSLIQVLTENSMLDSLFVDVHGARSPSENQFLYHAISVIENKSRLAFNWTNPLAADFSEGLAGACRAAGIYLELDRSDHGAVSAVLDALASGNNAIAVASIESGRTLGKTLEQKLADVLSQTKTLRHLILKLNWPEASVVTVLRALEQNRSVRILALSRMPFGKRSAKALGKLVEQNRKLNMLTVHLGESAYMGSDGWAQLRTVNRELKESVSHNRLLTSVNVMVAGENRAQDFAVKDTVRRNQALVNSAVNFVNGSTAKKDALAFETVQNCQSLIDTATMYGPKTETPVDDLISKARERLAADYLIFTRVVKARIVCFPDPRGKPRLDKLNKKCLARIGSFLSLTDVMDI